MTSLLENAMRSPRRPYWLLLVLALFLAGQVASASHWHDALDQADADCALCVLSSANGAAAIAKGWQFAAVLFYGIAVFLFVPMARRSVVRFHDSRAPPAFLSSSV
jgi:uncharacterized membrane protein YhaH (DUF805 family)